MCTYLVDCFRWIHLLLTVVFHVILMRDVEKHIGWFRVGIIYLGSGFAGNIFSGTFIPYFPAVRIQVSVSLDLCVCFRTYCIL